MVVCTVVVEEVMEGEEEMVVVLAGMVAVVELAGMMVVVVLAGMMVLVVLAGMMVLVVLAGMTVLVVLAVHISIGDQTIKLVAVVVLHPVKVLVDWGAQGVVDHIQSGMEVLQPVKVVKWGLEGAGKSVVVVKKEGETRCQKLGEERDLQDLLM
jgi:hypothetical protein